MAGIEDVKHIAANCNHYGMCKIDFLGNGICQTGLDSHYVAYYPQGRMEIVNALAENLIPVTERLVDVAESCTLCGICDKQCRYLTMNRTLKVMKALKEYVALHLKEKKPVEKPTEDEFLQKLRKVVSQEWATNDPAILVTYSRDRGLFDRRMPQYVVMPETSEEISQIVKIANEYKVTYTLRSNGANAQGLALGEGLIIDFTRMKKIELDEKNWCAQIEAGVTAFDLQKEANKHGMRACVAEPAACVCCNILLKNKYYL